MLFIISVHPNESFYGTVERALGQPPSSPILPLLTDLAQHDPYLADQLRLLHDHVEIRPSPSFSPIERIRTRLAWWLLGHEIVQHNQTHAALVRTIDSLIMHLNHERAARRLLSEQLALHASTTPTTLPSPAQPTISVSESIPSLVWHSSFASPTGYSGSSRAFVLGLDAHGVAIRPLFLYGTDHDEQMMMGRVHPRIIELQQHPIRFDIPQVIYAPGDRFCKNSGAYRIGFTMHETDQLPPTWVEQANQMHELWTPTAWGAEVFQMSGITRPIHIIPLGIDPTQFRPGAERTTIRNRTIFLSVFEWGMRKGWDILLRAYAAAFREDSPVLLLLKIDCHDPRANPIHDLMSHMPAHAPPVGILYNQTLSTEQLVAMYQGADSFVLPTRGEGWGMPILESMACGVPAIATAWSGITTFLTEQNGYPLPICRLVEADPAHIYYRGTHWAEPDIDALITHMQAVVDRPDEHTRRGAQAAHDALQWTWAQSIERVYARLLAI